MHLMGISKARGKRDFSSTVVKRKENMILEVRDSSRAVISLVSV